MSLLSVSNIALSGMNAAVRREAAAANNSANLLTPRYRRAVVAQSDQPNAGVVAKTVRVKEEGSDLVADVVDRIGALYAFKANILSLRVTDEMTGTVLNLKA